MSDNGQSPGPPPTNSVIGQDVAMLLPVGEQPISEAMIGWTCRGSDKRRWNDEPRPLRGMAGEGDGRWRSCGNSGQPNWYGC